MKLALAFVLASACGPAIPALPSKGGPAWHELTTEHFTLWTDSDQKTARELVAHMEDLRQAVIGVGFRGAANSGEQRAFVVALRDDDEVHAFMPGEFAAMATDGESIAGPPMILLPAESSNDPKGEITTHELTHTISHSVIRHQPRWFGEGLAVFFATIEIDRDAGTLDLGRSPTRRGEPLVMHHMTSLEHMFACRDLTCADASFYVTAWALFTYLFNRYPTQLTAYEDLLAHDVSGDDAWRQVFGALALGNLETELRDWLSHGSHTILKFNVVLRQWPVVERTLGDADVHATRALLRAEFQERLDDGQREVEAALAIDPKNALAIRVRDAIAALRATSRSHGPS